jgi:tRNA(Ile)-lysidine synthase
MRKLPRESSQRRPARRVEEAIRVRQLFSRGQRILVAVSGGLDSMVLLNVLHKLAPENRWGLSVAHLNHCLRGRSSDADEHLVRSVCKQLALPIFVERADVRQLVKKQKLSIEMAARKARHDFLVRIAKKEKISTIAVAHHADDQVELFFIRLLRGSGGEGLAGMKWHNPFPGAKRIGLVRPLFGESKPGLRKYAATNKIEFREDATNASIDILRNRIRHELLPLLRDNYQPALSKVVFRLMDIVGEESDLAKRAAEHWLRQASNHLIGGTGNTLSTSSWRMICSPLPQPSPLGRGRTQNRKAELQFSKLPVAVQRHCIRIQLMAAGISPDFEMVEKLRLKPDKGIAIDELESLRRLISRDSAGLVHWQTSNAVEFNRESRGLSLDHSAGQTKFNGIGISWHSQSKAGKNLPKRHRGTEYFDAELVGLKVILRHWRKGDRFHPIGMPTTVKLQDLFANQKVPRALRHQLVVAETEKGDIFWVEGLRISERFQLTKSTKRRLQWQWRRD